MACLILCNKSSTNMWKYDFTFNITMKTIGLIGGMSWESSLEYYRIINEVTKEKQGGLHSAQSLMYSVDFAEIETLQHQNKREELAQIMIDSALRLEKGGADIVVICTNTMHKLFPNAEKSVNIPVLHIADATAKKIVKNHYKKVWLLGTKFTMEEDFYKGRLVDDYDLEVVIPNENDRNIVHRIIYDELCLGIIHPDSKKEYQRIIKNLSNQWAEAIILGCTEIPLLIHQEDVEIPLFDTTKIHAEAAVERALQ